MSGLIAAYGIMFVMSVQRALAYRGGRALGVAAGFVLLLVQYSLWSSVYEQSASALPFGWRAMQTYIVIAFVLQALIATRDEMRIFSRVKDGDIALDLVRPLDFIGSQLAQQAGSAVVEAALRAAVAVLLSLFLFETAAPADALAGVLFLFSALLGFLTLFLISQLTAIACFRVLNVLGVLWTRQAVTAILSGAMVPLDVMPSWLASIARALPFAAIVDVPIKVYLGTLGGGAAAQAIGWQAMWVLILYVVARLSWRASVRALVVQGG